MSAGMFCFYFLFWFLHHKAVMCTHVCISIRIHKHTYVRTDKNKIVVIVYVNDAAWESPPITLIIVNNISSVSFLLFCFVCFRVYENSDDELNIGDFVLIFIFVFLMNFCNNCCCFHMKKCDCMSNRFVWFCYLFVEVVMNHRHQSSSSLFMIR